MGAPAESTVGPEYSHTAGLRPEFKHAD